MKIALSQMQVIPGSPEKNLATIKDTIAQAKQNNVDLLILPELCISGYMLSDMWLVPSFVEEMHGYNEVMREASDGIAIAYGNIVLDKQINTRLNDSAHHPNKDGRVRMYNAVCVVQNQQWVKRAKHSQYLPDGIQPKTLLPNYRFFDDQRYFFSLNDVALDMGVSIEDLAQPLLLEHNGKQVKIGFQVCEDLWCKDYRKDGKALNMSRYLINNGAELLINISASPWTNQKHDARDRRIEFLAQDVDQFVPFYYVNNVGPQNNGKNIITFDGGTTVYNAQGMPVQCSQKSFAPDLMFVEHEQLPQQKAVRSEPGKIEQKYQAIQSGLRYIKDMLGFEDDPKFVIGVSGGIDSALVVCLIEQAFGQDNVWALNMPTKYNSSATQNVAKHIADKLGIKHLQIPIQELTDAQMDVFTKLDEALPSPEWMRKLSDENIQAKIRGTSILSNLAGRYGRFFTNNGNKLETALGYATLYGDVGGVIAPIGDLTKAEVFEMARFMNEHIYQDEVIPHSLLPNELFEFGEGDIAPSAELREAQLDPMKFGYHCALLEKFTSFAKTSCEDVMQWYLQGSMEENLGISTALIQRWGVDEPASFVEDLEWFARNIQRNVYKRIQSPPIIVTSPSAYGFDIRESQMPWRTSERFNQLKQQVLKMEKYNPG
ncbi:NAD(+) synthase [Paraneptunicella aestuarii]|uniref:NAD(+) synthase n=1 Tax=Paraneptunicella aestuarii TaxID=2831148 RepID=UPI001E4729BF|nr:NAD(+) synthase [Paraneptunicella aestuarii]UAA39342.1 NAD(+) synthase [Paraneptunicella aestuarii]